MRRFARLTAFDRGFDPNGVRVMRIALDTAAYRGGGPSEEFYRALLPRLAALPGVVEAGAVSSLPISVPLA